MTRPVPSPRSAYPHFEEVPPRWADTDIYGHMNNAVHYLLFDTAVARFLLRAGVLDLGASDGIFLVVSSGCDYFDEIVFSDRLQAGVRVDRLGRSSVRYGIGLFRNDEPAAAAEGFFVHVCVGRRDRRPRALDDPIRAALERIA